MRRPRPLLSTVPALLLMLLLAALALAAAACDELGSADATTTTPPTTSAPAPDTAAAQQTGGGTPAGSVLFHDDFQDGDAQGWQVDGAWVVQQDGGIYTFSTSGQGYAPVPAGVGWDGDYAYRAVYLLQSGTLAFTFDATTVGRYYVSIDAAYISLVKDEAGERTVLTQAPAPEIGAQHYIVMAKQRGTIHVYVDKVLWLSYQDASPLTAGTIAVGAVDGTTAWVDDVLVNVIQVQLPQNAAAVAPVDPGDVVAPEDDGADLDSLPDDPADVPELPDNNVPEEMPGLEVTFLARSGNEVVRPGDTLTVAREDMLTLEWQVSNAQEVRLQDLPVDPFGSTEFPMRTDDTFELSAVDLNGVSQTFSIDVHVTGEPVVHGPDVNIEVIVTPLDGRQVHVAIGVTNVGDEATGGFTVRWYAHANSGVVDGSKTYSAFSPGGLNWFYLDYTYAGHGTMHWMATADEEDATGDVDLSNNTVRGTVEIE